MISSGGAVDLGFNIILNKFSYHFDENYYTNNKADIGGAICIKNFPFTFT